MPSSSIIKTLQAIWNALYRDSALRAFRLTVNSTTGGNDFDISLSNESFPLGDEVPRQDESPAILVTPEDPWELAVNATHKNFEDRTRYRVRIWIYPDSADEAFRFHELVKYALLRGHEQRWVDHTSPALTFPNVQMSEIDPPGSIKALTDADERLWWRADFYITVQHRFNLDTVT